MSRCDFACFSKAVNIYQRERERKFVLLKVTRPYPKVTTSNQCSASPHFFLLSKKIFEAWYVSGYSSNNLPLLTE